MPTDSTAHFPFGDWIGAEVAYAVNVGARWALGRTAALETGNQSTRYRLGARARRWLGTRLYAEVLPGVFRQVGDGGIYTESGIDEGTGFTLEARAGVAGVLFASARYDVMGVDPVTTPVSTSGQFVLDPGGTAHAFSVGGGLEGRTALLASAATLVVGGVLVLLVGLPGAWASGLSATGP